MASAACACSVASTANFITPRGEKIRVISLRRANAREERAYDKERQPSRP